MKALTNTLATTLITTLVGMTLATPALADRSSKRKNTFIEYAEVVNVSPRYREVSYQRPKQECWIEEQQHVIRDYGYDNRQNNRRPSRASNGGDVLIGGVIGGVIGNQLSRKGSNRARTGATVAGAIIGSALAGENSSRNKRHRRHSQASNRFERRAPRYEVRPVKRCENTTETHYEQRLQGYDVTYRYRGERYTTRMKRDPGNRIKIQVSIQPLR